MIITKVAVQHRLTVMVLMLAVVLVGMYSYMATPREAAPDVQIPIILVITTYVGVSPEDMESSVTMKIEKKLKGLSGVDEIRSTSAENVSMIEVEFLPTVDIDDAYQKVRDKVDLAKPDLPDDAEEPFLMEINVSEFPIMLINLSGTCGLRRLKELAENLEDEIEAIRGVLDVQVSGGLDREVRIEVDPARMAAYDVPLEALLSLIPRENMNVTAGNLELAEGRYSLRVPAEFDTPREIQELVLFHRGGVPVYLRDVAEVVDGFEEPESYSRMDGKESVSLSVQKRTGENIMEIATEIKTLLEKWELSLPEGTELGLSFDQSKDIEVMVADLENGIFSGLVLVLIVILFFIGGRNAFFIALAIPFSMFISFAVLYALGITMNMVVLFSLILALGMLVDNAIVIVENVYRHYHLTGNRTEAVLSGVEEVAWPVITSTLTTVCAFFPLLFWPGIVGDFMGYLPKTVIITLSASLFVALVFSPTLCAVFMRLKKGHRAEDADHTPRLIRAYQTVLQLCLRHWFVTLFIGFLALIGTVDAYRRWGKGIEFFPEADPKRVSIKVEAPQGTSLDGSNQVVREIEAALQGVPDVKYVISNVGSQGQSRMSFGGMAGSATHMSTMYVDFVDWEERSQSTAVTVEEIRNRMPERPGVDIQVKKDEIGPPQGAPVSVEVSGESMDSLEAMANRMKEIIEGVPGLIELRDDLDRARPEVQFVVDRERASLLGVSTAGISRTLRMAIHGIDVGDFREGNDEYDIVVRLPEKYRDSMEELKSLTVPDAMGRPVPISSVVRMVHAGGLGAINRKDQKRQITVEGDVSGRLADDVLQDVKARLEGFHLPPGYRIEYTGENEMMLEAIDFLGKAFVAAVLLIAMVLITQFNSLLNPTIILYSVILSLIGVFISLMVLDRPFGVILTGIGCISLAGVVVNNAIVLIDYIGKLRDRGLDLIEALVEAGGTRFRPVMLTAVTTILSLVPMALGISLDVRRLTVHWEGSESSQWWGSMATAVIFGLSIATLLTLILVPCMYLALERLRGLGERVRGKKDVVLLLLLILVWCQGVTADDGSLTLELPQAIDMALENNPRILGASKQVEGKVAARAAARGRRYPDVTLSATGVRQKTGGQFGSTNEEAFQSLGTQLGIEGSLMGGEGPFSSGAYPYYEGKVEVEGPLFTWWRLKRAEEVSVQEIRLAEMSLEELRQSLCFEVTKAFCDVLLAEAKKAVANYYLQLNEEHLQRAESRYQVGLATEFDVLRSEVNFENAKPPVLRYGREAKVAGGQLNVLLGRLPSEEIQVRGELESFAVPPLDLESLMGMALANRLDIAKLNKRIEMMEKSMKINSTHNRPSAFYVGHYGTSTTVEGDLFGSDAESWSLGVGFSWPLFDGFESVSLVREDRANVEAAEKSLESLMDQVRLAVQSGVDHIEVASQVIEAMELNVERAEEALRIAENNYGVGLATTLDVMDAQGGLAKAKMEWVQGLYDKALACAELLWVVGEFTGAEALERFYGTRDG